LATARTGTKAGINDAVVMSVVVKGLADRDAAGALTLTDRGPTTPDRISYLSVALGTLPTWRSSDQFARINMQRAGKAP
jgi:hypothetical protein